MKKSRMYAAVAVITLLALGSFFWYGGSRSENEADTLCTKLASQERQDRVGIVTDGVFLSHHENFAYVGDLVSFKLAVAYNPLTTEVFDERLLQFDTSPFVRLAKSPVRTTTYEGCTIKRATFDLRVLNVEIGTHNAFKFLDADGIKRIPEMPYTVNGVRRDASVSYDKLFVAPLTSGTPVPPRDFPLVFLEDDFSMESENTSLIALMLVGAGSLLFGGSLLGFGLLFRRYRRSNTSGPLENPEILPTLFPDLYANLNPKKDLKSTYFALSIYIDCLGTDTFVDKLESLRERVSIVFSDTDDEEQLREAVAWIKERLVSLRPELESRREILVAKREET